MLGSALDKSPLKQRPPCRGLPGSFDTPSFGPVESSTAVRPHPKVEPSVPGLSPPSAFPLKVRRRSVLHRDAQLWSSCQPAPAPCAQWRDSAEASAPSLDTKIMSSLDKVRPLLSARWRGKRRSGLNPARSAATLVVPVLAQFPWELLQHEPAGGRIWALIQLACSVIRIQHQSHLSK